MAGITPRQTQRDATTQSLIKVIITLLTLATAFIHLYIAFPRFSTFPILFYLNAIGYIVFLVLFFLSQNRGDTHRAICWIFAAYTLLTMLLYFFLARASLIGYIDKTIEVLLIIFLLVEARSTRLI